MLGPAGAAISRLVGSSSEEPRLVGRVVDPLARDDGGTEPEVLDAPPRAPSAAADDEGALETSEPPAPTETRGQSVRDRLLARAAAARDDGFGVDRPAYDEGESRTFDDELDLIARRPERPPTPLVGRSSLSPNLRAVIATLGGVAAVATCVALGLRLDQRRAVQEPTPSATVTADAPVATVTAPPPVPKRVRQKLPGPWRIEDDASGAKKVRGKVALAGFIGALSEAGLETKQAYRVHNVLKEARATEKYARTDEFIALVDPASKTVKAFEYVVSKEEVWQLREGPDGILAGKKLDLAVARTEVRAALQIDAAGLAAAIERAGMERDLDAALRKALDGHMGLEELHRGDVLRLVAQEITVLGEFSRYGGIEVLEYRPAAAGDKPLTIYYFNGQNERGYFDAEGRSPYEGGWRKPVKDARITSKFNPKRMHPVLHKIMPHNGTDFGAATGTPVGAANYGTVKTASYSGPCGNMVSIEHAGGIETGYCHLSRFAEGLKVGDHVKRLQLIGYVGTTGRSTGPHLHFWAKRGGEFFDAESLNLDSMRVLPKEERASFGEAKAKYDALLGEIALPEPLPSEAPARPAADDASSQAAPQGDLGAGAAAVIAAPGAPAPAPAPAGSGRRGSVFLTDKELLERQGRDDDGESED